MHLHSHSVRSFHAQHSAPSYSSKNRVVLDWHKCRWSGALSQRLSWVGGVAVSRQTLRRVLLPLRTTDLRAVGSAAHPAASQSQITQLKSVGSVTYADLGEAATSRWGWQWAALAIISYPGGGTIANLGMASAAASLLCTCIICQFISHLFPYYLIKCSHRNGDNEREVKISRNAYAYRCISVPISIPDALPWLLSSVLLSFNSLSRFSLFCKPILYQRLY